MDRDMKKGVIGLHSLWLSDTTAKTKKDHDLLKAEMSSLKYFEQREEKGALHKHGKSSWWCLQRHSFSRKAHQR